jgi:hypothetical protein
MKTLFRNTILFAIVFALELASLPLSSVSAAGEYDPPVPEQRHVTHERLERVWARQLRLYQRIGNGFEREDRFMARAQELIDRAEANGKNVSRVQAALDDFEAAVKDARPIYESANGIVNSHQGFDENGKVTDPEKAQETIQAMREKLQQIKDAIGGTRKALREAIKAFRESNPRP